MNLVYIFKDEYNKKIKIGKKEFFAYSKSKLKKINPDNDYKIIAEVKKTDKKKEGIGKVQIKDSEFTVFDKDKNSKILYYKAGYFQTGEKEYVQVLKSRIPFILWFLGLLAGIAILCGIIFGIMNKPTQVSSNPLPKVDPYLEDVEKDKGDKIKSEDGGGAVSMVYSLKAELSLSTNEIKMFFQNPNESNQNALIELCIVSGEDTHKIAASGIILPGTMLQKLVYDPNVVVLNNGIYKAIYKVICYDEKTGERSLVEGKIDNVEVTVVN